jgi:hypothetical protein
VSTFGYRLYLYSLCHMRRSLNSLDGNLLFCLDIWIGDYISALNFLLDFPYFFNSAKNHGSLSIKFFSGTVLHFTEHMSCHEGSFAKVKKKNIFSLQTRPDPFIRRVRAVQRMNYLNSSIFLRIVWHTGGGGGQDCKNL